MLLSLVIQSKIAWMDSCRCSLFLSFLPTTGPLNPGENGSPGISSLGMRFGVRIGDVLVHGLQVQGVLQRTDAREVDEPEEILDGPLEGCGKD